MRCNGLLACVAGLAIMCVAGQAAAQRHFSFGYDQPRTTGFGVAADIFFRGAGEKQRRQLGD